MTPIRRRSVLGVGVLAAGLCIPAACAEESEDPAAPNAPALVAPPAPHGDALAEIAAFTPGPGQSLDVVEVQDERGQVVLRRGVLRDADGMVNHGHFQRWHPNGQLAEDGHYLAGERHGRYAVIADSGLKETEIEYRRGIKHGESLTWGKVGVLRERARYVDGVLDGPYEALVGDQRVRGTYERGSESGTWTWTDMEGRLRREGDFAAGERTGLWRSWHANGALASEEHYAGGLLEGLVVEYDENGVRRAERNYKANQPHGECREYHPDGTPASRIAYSEGVPHGPQTRWYENGVVQMEGAMERGKRSGPWIYNRLDGTRNEAWSGTYEADVRVGD
jgi:antitoxin component YwqK of YwqJK toxin-antitoxin module